MDKSPMLAGQHSKILDTFKQHGVPRLARMHCRPHAFNAEIDAAVTELRDLGKPSGFAWGSRKVGLSDAQYCPYDVVAYAANMSTPRMPIMNDQDEHFIDPPPMKLIS